MDSGMHFVNNGDTRAPRVLGTPFTDVSQLLDVEGLCVITVLSVGTPFDRFDT